MAEAVTETGPSHEASQGRLEHAGLTPEASLDCVITIDPDDRIVEFNAAAERTFRVRAEDVLGRDLAEVLLPPRLQRGHREGLARYLATGDGRILDKAIEMPAARGDGTEFLAAFTITRTETDAGPRFTVHLNAGSRAASSAGGRQQEG